MTLHLETLGADDEEAWNRFVSESPQGCVFSQTTYLKALGVRYKLMAVTSGSRMLGGIVVARGALGAAALPLFVKYGGVLLSPLQGGAVKRRSREYEIQSALIRGLRSYQFFEYNFHPGYDNWLPFLWAGYRQTTRYTYRIPSDRQGAWQSSAHERVRRHIRHAGSYRVAQVSAAWKDPQIHGLVMAPYRRAGAPAVISPKRFAVFLRELEERHLGRIYRIRGETGSCAAVLVEDRRCSYLLAHGCADSTDSYMNTCLIARMIEDTLPTGRAFDFEGSVIRPIEHYYRAFGGELIPYYRIWHPGVLATGRRALLDLGKRVLRYGR